MEHKRILWVEDDSELLMGLIKPLEKDGHEIIIANDEKDALDKIKDFNFDLFLIDIILPSGMKNDDGKEHFIGIRLIENILKDMKLKTPIIVLSVVRDQELINKMYDIGVKKVLPKGSFLPTKLKEEIYKVFEGKNE